MIFHEVSIFLSNDKNLENSDIQKELKIKSLSNNLINQNVEFSMSKKKCDNNFQLLDCKK